MKADESKFTRDLTEDQRKIVVDGGTEPAFSGEYVHFDETGTFTCVACGNALFSSKTKFDSGTGWPSFYDVIDSAAVKLNEDRSHGMQRIEVRCGHCLAHLGHVFHDAPDQPTGVRFCINSVALDFKSPSGDSA